MCLVVDMLLINSYCAYLMLTSSLLRFHLDKNDGLPFWEYDLAECTLLPKLIVLTIATRITKIYIQRLISNMSNRFKFSSSSLKHILLLNSLFFLFFFFLFLYFLYDTRYHVIIKQLIFSVLN